MNDGISAMSSIFATQLPASSMNPVMAPVGANPPSTQAVQEVSLFEHALSKAEAKHAVAAPSETELMAVKPLDYINNEAAEIYNYAKEAVASGNDLTPSEVVMLTARSHEFMFHCQLTANVANRTSDGIQQLFRQQS